MLALDLEDDLSEMKDEYAAYRKQEIATKAERARSFEVNPPPLLLLDAADVAGLLFEEEEDVAFLFVDFDSCFLDELLLCFTFDDIFAQSRENVCGSWRSKQALRRI